MRASPDELHPTFLLSSAVRCELPTDRPADPPRMKPLAVDATLSRLPSLISITWRHSLTSCRNNWEAGFLVRLNGYNAGTGAARIDLYQYTARAPWRTDTRSRLRASEIVRVRARLRRRPLCHQPPRGPKSTLIQKTNPSPTLGNPQKSATLVAPQSVSRNAAWLTPHVRLAAAMNSGTVGCKQRPARYTLFQIEQSSSGGPSGRPG